jgi:hypothetical protein
VTATLDGNQPAGDRLLEIGLSSSNGADSSSGPSKGDLVVKAADVWTFVSALTSALEGMAQAGLIPVSPQARALAESPATKARQARQ